MNETTETVEQHPSSIFPPDGVQFPEKEHGFMYSFVLIIVLMLAFILIKGFIYNKDQKRHDK